MVHAIKRRLKRSVKKKTLVDCTKFVQRDMDVTGLGFLRGETPFEQDPPVIIQP